MGCANAHPPCSAYFVGTYKAISNSAGIKMLKLMYFSTYRMGANNNRGHNSKSLFLAFRLSHMKGIKIAF